MTPCTSPARALRRSVALLLVAGACGRDASRANGGAGDPPAGDATTPAASPARSDAPAAFTTADLDAYERGLAKEIELVRAAQERARTATTPQERGAAAQAQWEDQTIPDGARSAGLPAERYRQLRATVGRVLQTLDFQGKIEGPMQMDTARATPEMRQRLTSDPFAELTPASAAALHERLDRLAPIWVQYVTLTAVAG